MNPELANKIYDVLCEMAGANRDERDSFVFHHANEKYPCKEWRFGGKFGFGGKYYADRNEIGMYPENENKDRLILMEKVNRALKDIFRSA